MPPKLIDQMSFIVAGIIFIIALLLFYHDTGRFLGSAAAALMAAALSWVSYVLTRWLALALWR